MLLETYWKRTESTVPIYFSAGLIEKANLFYRLFVDWLNEKIQESFSQGDNVFEFKKVKPFDKNLINYNVPIEQRYVFNDLRLVDEKEIHMPL